MASSDLRPVEAGDLPIFFEQQLEPESNRMAGTAPRDREAFMAHWAKIQADPSITIRTVLVGGAVAGNIATFLLGTERELSYWLGREFWGRGAATGALSAFLLVVPARPLFIRAAKRNPPSRRVAEKCGFCVVAEDRYENRAGEWIDEFVLRLD